MQPQSNTTAERPSDQVLMDRIQRLKALLKEGSSWGPGDADLDKKKQLLKASDAVYAAKREKWVKKKQMGRAISIWFKYLSSDNDARADASKINLDILKQDVFTDIQVDRSNPALAPAQPPAPRIPPVPEVVITAPPPTPSRSIATNKAPSSATSQIKRTASRDVGAGSEGQTAKKQRVDSSTNAAGEQRRRESNGSDQGGKGEDRRRDLSPIAEEEGGALGNDALKRKEGPSASTERKRKKSKKTTTAELTGQLAVEESPSSSSRPQPKRNRNDPPPDHTLASSPCKNCTTRQIPCYTGKANVACWPCQTGHMSGCNFSRYKRGQSKRSKSRGRSKSRDRESRRGEEEAANSGDDDDDNAPTSRNERAPPTTTRTNIPQSARTASQLSTPDATPGSLILSNPPTPSVPLDSAAAVLPPLPRRPRPTPRPRKPSFTTSADTASPNTGPAIVESAINNPIVQASASTQESNAAESQNVRQSTHRVIAPAGTTSEPQPSQLQDREANDAVSDAQGNATGADLTFTSANYSQKSDPVSTEMVWQMFQDLLTQGISKLDERVHDNESKVLGMKSALGVLLESNEARQKDADRISKLEARLDETTALVQTYRTELELAKAKVEQQAGIIGEYRNLLGLSGLFQQLPFLSGGSNLTAPTPPANGQPSGSNPTSFTHARSATSAPSHQGHPRAQSSTTSGPSTASNHRDVNPSTSLPGSSPLPGFLPSGGGDGFGFGEVNPSMMNVDPDFHSTPVKSSEFLNHSSSMHMPPPTTAAHDQSQSLQSLSESARCKSTNDWNAFSAIRPPIDDTQRGGTSAAAHPSDTQLAMRQDSSGVAGGFTVQGSVGAMGSGAREPPGDHHGFDTASRFQEGQSLGPLRAIYSDSPLSSMSHSDFSSVSQMRTTLEEQ
ncbi:hypothetical protein CC1G_10127 [Coprinopsis cinerea okayama7|uniref:Zn(2)-C6 fungal-type domain-containing protein n=1 Tax=Coprinopsis cinerea (strain Okayama-7 / 130 / ATCC MYA-4618 / FGSC 9003) TaxID=240176 RepID=A8N3Y8_COPC7|nr:hypothetical protein CC1G_10127 [Coprinopsis cinerea okayama7\|eukprot:XP_001829597.2 hypothetical protein CC1G_10127 [Coprinopsis cinerea okayama7\